MLMARMLGISQYLKIEMQIGFMRGGEPGTGNSSATQETGVLPPWGSMISLLLSTCLLHFSFCFHFATFCFFTIMHNRTSLPTLKFIHSLMILWPWVWGSLRLVFMYGLISCGRWNQGFTEHCRPYFYGRGGDAGYTTLRREVCKLSRYLKGGDYKGTLNNVK